MARKGENIFRRKDGRWEARYSKGHDASGKMLYGFCYGKTYAEAKEKVTRAKQVFQEDSLRKNEESLRFGTFCDKWLSLRKDEVRESTYIKYRGILENHIKPVFGKDHLDKLSSERVEVFKHELLQKGLSPKSVKDVLVVFREVLKETKQEFPTLCPEIVFHYPKIRKKEVRVLSVGEERELISYLISRLDNCNFGILLVLLTGLRLGEICALQWKNISMEDQTIRIDSTLLRLNNSDPREDRKTELRLGNPKSETSCRYIPMSDGVLKLCQEMGIFDPDVFVLTGKTYPMDPRTLQYRFQKCAEECGLEGIHFHTLRHSFATRCAESGFEIKSLSEILGHTNPSITLKAYVHSSMEYKRDSINKISIL